MPNSPGRFRAAVSVGWVALGLAALVYARMKGIPAWAALPIAAAFLIELPFYLLPAFHPARLRNPFLLTLTCLLPYLVYSLPTGQFHWRQCLELTACMALVSFWFDLFPAGALTDALFLLLLTSIELTKIFASIYLLPTFPKLQLSTLGHVMLIRAAAISIIAIRDGTVPPYKFLPNAHECKVGLKWFAFMLPVSLLSLLQLNLWRLRPHPNPLAGIAVFFGILWVVALSEEFFFRGLLQNWLERWTGNTWAALAAASLLFGAAHLFHYFPNWRYAAIAAILGLFSGLAWRETRTIQASMVTHALAATLYRVFFLG